MLKRVVLSLVLLTTVCVADAHAGFNLAVSVGEGFGIRDKHVYRTPFNLEIIPAYKIWWLKLDLGLLTDLDKKVNFTLRPGFRFGPSFIYLRGAAHLRLTRGFDPGFLVGIGTSFLPLWIIRFFAEIDTFLTRDGDFKSVPIEFRLGVEFGF
ncbi:MAG: hypothetical protein KC609_22930 [Myxococcales bacterium]|nr:hypothetical protein [Myxococcales bacterium]